MQDHIWYRYGEEPKEGEADARPVFKIRMASMHERGDFESLLVGRHRAVPVSAFVFVETAIEGIRALVGEEADELEELLRGSHGDETRAKITPEERAQIDEIERILIKCWPPYRLLVEQNTRYRNLMPLLAVQHFVADWENVTGLDGAPVAFTRNKIGEIPDAVLRRLHPKLIDEVGTKAYMFQYAVGEEKN